MEETTKPKGSGALTRRSFLEKTAVATAVTAGFPYIIPASALGLDGTTAPSNRHVMGCIGVGSQGTGNMKNFLDFGDVQLVAVADVDRGHRQNAQHIINERYGNEDCAGYNDFREMLARTDLDAVSIAVPDHWHSIPAIAAAKAGLDIYAEKPLALTIAEGRAMVETVHRYGVVWQTGSWQRSVGHFRKACELVRNGRLGEVKRCFVGLPTGSAIETQAPMPVPDGFDYNFWLGQAPEAPYTEQRCHWNFRWILDYSGGQLTDWGAHHCDIANWGMNTEHTSPVSIGGSGTFPREGLWNAATDYKFACWYPAGASTVSPKGFEMHVSNSYEMGVLFEGESEWIQVSRRGMKASSEDLMREELGAGEKPLYKSDNHFRNFLDCRASRQPTITPIDVAHRAITVAHLGNIAMQLERPVHYDPVNERFVDDAQADRKLWRAMRGPWSLEG